MIPAGLLHPTDDMDASVAFFRDVLGLKETFRDGDRYCAFDYGGQTLGLVGGAEKIVTATALVLRVADVPAAIETLTAGGAQVLWPAEEGPHEIRAVLRAPDGGQVVLSARK